jgi:arginase family enzyme
MVLGLSIDGGEVLAQKQLRLASRAVKAASMGGSMPTYVVLGVPLRTGSLYPGNENDAQAYREAGLLGRLNAAGCKVMDAGDLPIPSYLPHHSVPPIRSWPGPRIVWDIVNEKVAEIVRQPEQIPILIGCDCSLVVGTAHALHTSFQDVHVLYIDGDFDDAAPAPEKCQSAASCATWLLTRDSALSLMSPLKPSQVSQVGWTRPPQTEQAGMPSFSLAEVRRIGARQLALQVLAAVPASAAILLHLDIDVFRSEDLPAAYFPHPEGLSLGEGAELLEVFFRDPRIRLIEISEYATLSDRGQESIHKIIDMLVGTLPKSQVANHVS